jgi:hypothetical protein
MINDNAVIDEQIGCCSETFEMQVLDAGSFIRCWGSGSDVLAIRRMEKEARPPIEFAAFSRVQRSSGRTQTSDDVMCQLRQCRVHHARATNEYNTPLDS